MHNKSAQTWWIHCPISAQIGAGCDCQCYHYHYIPSFQIFVSTCYSINFELNTITLKKYNTKKTTLPTTYRPRTFIIQLAKLLYEVLWGLTPIGTVEGWCGTYTCWFHIRSLPFYGTNTELSQLSIFHSIMKCCDNNLFLHNGLEFQRKVNNDTSTPWNRH